MAVAVLVILALAFAAPFLHRFLGDHTGWVLGLVPASIFVYFIQFLPAVADGAVPRTEIPWSPGIGVAFAFRLDGLSLMFALLVTGMGALIITYAGTYLKGDPLRGRFLMYFLMFMGAMLGLVLSDNLILLFVFWEMTSFSSYLLIGYKHKYEESRKSALQALLVTGGGGLFLLAGLIVLSIAAGGTFSLAEVLVSGEAIRGHDLYLLAFGLIVMGCFTKSAQVPFHFWLPNAMAAPTPVSAYLHSATMVKAGVYLLARMHPALGGTTAWITVLSVFGAATMLTGAVLALRHSDLKKVLAYSTITALGTLVMLLGLSYDDAIKAGMVFLLVHALYKGALFLVAGSVDHESGTRDVLALRGLRKTMPITFGAAIIAALSMAGIPPLFGFIGKELVYEAALHVGDWAWVLAGVAVLANALTVAAAAIVAIRPFLGEPTEAARNAHEAPLAMWLGPVTLAACGVLLGLLPAVTAVPLISAAVGTVLGTPPFALYLTLWHGVNMALILSVVTLGLGILIFWKWDTVRGGLERMDPVMARGPEKGYYNTLSGMLRFAGWQTGVIQNGNLRYYIMTTVVVGFGLTGLTFLLQGVGIAAPFPDVPFFHWIVVALIAGGAIIAAQTRVRLLAAAAIGVAGFGVALLFILMGAPDLAMTQFLVETLIVVVILLVMQQLPTVLAPKSPRASQFLNLGIAVVSGVTVSVLLLAVLRVPFNPELADFFVSESVPGGFGHNIVNVILVDFRALDTLGEIAVLGFAAIGAFALLWRRKDAPHAHTTGPEATETPEVIESGDPAAELSRQ